jgi:L-threonylcarbamoyladenylate synthase
MLKAEVSKALEIVREGGIILYPTDTVWGLGCDATNAEAVSRIFRLKGRSAEKSLIVLLDQPARLPSYVTDVPDIAYDLIDFAEKPLTIIFSGARNLAAGIIHQDGTAGIRIVKHDFCRQLISRLRKPLVSTSANLSGEPTPGNFSQVSQEVILGVDYVVNLQQNDRSINGPSAIMRLESDGRFSFIRR